MNPLWAARLAPLELRARVLAEGALAGRHAGSRRGLAGDFDGHRAYAPGDEPRRVDWKMFARSDRWTVRESQVESHLLAALLLDVSGSMAFSHDGRPPKSEYAAALLSALSYVLIRRQEAAGLGLLTDRLKQYLPPRASREQLARLLELLDRTRPEGPTDLGRALTEVLPRLPRRAVVVLASDFLQPPERWLPALRAAASRGHDVVAFQVLDPVELDFNLAGDFRFEDMESDGRLVARGADLAPRYRALMAERQRSMSQGLAAARVEHVLFRTDRPAEEGLGLFLRRRMSRL